MVIAIDMDGTIADLYGYPDWLDALRNDENPDPYRYCAPLCDTDELGNALQDAIDSGIEVYIISWNCGGSPSREYRRRVMAAKRAWLEQYRIPYTRLRVVPNGTAKGSIIGDESIAYLFDDELRNREAWVNSGEGRRAYGPDDIASRIRDIVKEMCG